MASGLPVVATNWGGPADYLDATCGILVDPDSRSSFIAGLAEAMHRLAISPELRLTLGRSGRERVVRDFDWEKKIEQLVSFYERLSRVARQGPESTGDDSTPSQSATARSLVWLKSWPFFRPYPAQGRSALTAGAGAGLEHRRDWAPEFDRSSRPWGVG
jgi:hypothetical protein